MQPEHIMLYSYLGLEGEAAQIIQKNDQKTLQKTHHEALRSPHVHWSVAFEGMIAGLQKQTQGLIRNC